MTNVSQSQMDPGEQAAPPGRGAWVRPCGAPGPFCIRRPTPTQPFRLEIVTCTRPENHAGPFHDYATADRGVLARWGRDGRPDYPPLIEGGARRGPAHPV